MARTPEEARGRTSDFSFVSETHGSVHLVHTKNHGGFPDALTFGTRRATWQLPLGGLPVERAGVRLRHRKNHSAAARDACFVRTQYPRRGRDLARKGLVSRIRQ